MRRVYTIETASLELLTGFIENNKECRRKLTKTNDENLKAFFLLVEKSKASDSRFIETSLGIISAISEKSYADISSALQ
jgi:hypothetical protein